MTSLNAILTGLLLAVGAILGAVAMRVAFHVGVCG